MESLRENILVVWGQSWRSSLVEMEYIGEFETFDLKLIIDKAFGDFVYFWWLCLFFETCKIIINVNLCIDSL